MSWKCSVSMLAKKCASLPTIGNLNENVNNCLIIHLPCMNVCVKYVFFTVNLQDIHLKKPYRSSITKDQQVISRSTIPRSVLEVYSLCDLPPCLGKLNKFRHVTLIEHHFLLAQP